jgi:multiple antibiotic resistance protein
MLLAILHALVPLFVVVNPLGAVPLFLAMTEEVGREHRARTAIYAALTCGGILIATALAGQAIFHFFGVSVDALRIAGGSLLFLYALDMVQNRRPRMRTTEPEVEDGAAKQEVGVIPLGIPMLSGPGAIATVLVLRVQSAGQQDALLPLLGAVIAIALLTWLTLNLAVRLARWLSPTVLGIVIRLEALMLSAIAVQMLIAGIQGAFGLMTGR